MKKYKAIFIDWDDTIGDWKGAESDALHEMFEKHHLSEFYPSPDEFIAVYEDFNRTMWELYGMGKVTKEYLARERFVHPLVYPLGIDHEKAPQPFIALADKMAEEFLALTSKYFRPLPGTVEVVREVAKHYPLTLISNGFKEVQYYKIEHSGLKDCFKHVLISEEVGINKPLPGIYEEGLRRNVPSVPPSLLLRDPLHIPSSPSKLLRFLMDYRQPRRRDCHVYRAEIGGYTDYSMTKWQRTCRWHDS